MVATKRFLTPFQFRQVMSDLLKSQKIRNLDLDPQVKDYLINGLAATGNLIFPTGLNIQLSLPEITAFLPVERCHACYGYPTQSFAALKSMNLTLQITNLYELATNLNRYCKLVKFKGSDYRWFDIDVDGKYPLERILLERIWFNATRYDLHHSHSYVEQLINQIGDDRLADFNNKFVNLGYIKPFGAHLTVINAGQHWAYETAEALVFNFVKNEGEVPRGLSGRLPTIRYGVDNDKVVVYAIQLETLARAEQEKDIVLVNEGLKEEGEPEGSLDNKIRRIAYKIDRSLKRGYWDSMSAEKITSHQIFRPSLISLTAALCLFNSRGVKWVLVPKYLPVRIQEHALNEIKTLEETGLKPECSVLEQLKQTQKISRVTTSKLVEVFKQAAFLLDGLEIVDLTTDTGTMKLVFDAGTLTSRDPILQNILDQICVKADKP